MSLRKGRQATKPKINKLMIGSDSFQTFAMDTAIT